MISLGFLLFAVLFVLSVALGGIEKLIVFWDILSVLFLLSGLVGYILLYGRKGFSSGMKLVFFLLLAPLLIWGNNVLMHLNQGLILLFLLLAECVFLLVQKKLWYGTKIFFAFSFPTDDEAIETGRFFLRLTEFTLAWGLLIMFLGVVWLMSDLDPDTVGGPMAVSVLSILYAIGLAVFVFLPIGLRLSPPTLQPPVFWRFSIRQLLAVFGVFFLLRLLAIVLLIVLAQKPGFRGGPIHSGEFGNALRQAAFAFNPADPQGTDTYLSFPASLVCYYDLPSLILVVGGWWAFRLASGKRRKLIAAPVVILIGLTGTIIGFVLMLCDLDPETFGAGFFVSTPTTLYAFIAAVGFLVADMRSGDYGVPSSPALLGSEETEQAKKIIENVVERERS